MAAMFPSQVSAVQVGTFFVGQYYNILQQQPSLVHQFYNEASTMMRVDGDTTETASGMMQIHSLILSLNFTGIEIKTAHFLNSWGDGVLVLVSGLVQTREYNGRRKFVQTFFLAPQEKGFFVLSDFFHFLEEEQMHQPAKLSHESFENSFSAANTIPEAVSDNAHQAESQSKDIVVPVQEEENDTINEYFPEPHQEISKPDNFVDESPAEEPVASLPSVTITTWDPPAVPLEEPVGELPKQTYASILRAAKGLSGTISQSAPLSKASPTSFERHQAPLSTSQQTYSTSSMMHEKSSFEAVEEVSALEDEVGSKSVYVGNVPSSVSESDLENEFKNFGRIRPDGVAIRSRKESGGHYAFVEFEDVGGVQNALKASPIQINGWQIYVEERRPNSGMLRGGRRGRGRGGYLSEAPRGRFSGRSYGRAGQDTNDREYNSRAKGNGFHQRVPQ